jgi:hypothetical protein
MNLDKIRTAVSGVSSGPEADLRQAALAILQEAMKENPTQRYFLDMVPEPDNPYDVDAIKLMLDLPALGGRMQLGYVKNAQTRCTFCDQALERNPASGICPHCNHQGQLVREGIASKLAPAMRSSSTDRWYCEITEITGGTGNKKSFGCNIRIAKVYQRKPQTMTPAAESSSAIMAKDPGQLNDQEHAQEMASLAELVPPGSGKRHYDLEG